MYSALVALRQYGLSGGPSAVRKSEHQLAPPPPPPTVPPLGHAAHSEHSREHNSGQVGGGGGASKKKPCKVCKGFGDAWGAFEKQGDGKRSNSGNSNSAKSSTSSPSTASTDATQDSPGYKDCPEDVFSLGRKTWGFLHTMAATYPEEPTAQDQADMQQLMELFAKFYPCGACAHHLREYLQTEPPETASQFKFAQWMCRMHNSVNRRVGKPEFDCANVDQRWADGWDDGSCE
eukprot:m.102875 g.102875  ORF g.102875 m.102875 type:complete len:233 (+) comp15545_c0_seq1:147-845(+)